MIYCVKERRKEALINRLKNGELLGSCMNKRSQMCLVSMMQERIRPPSDETFPIKQVQPYQSQEECLDCLKNIAQLFIIDKQCNHEDNEANAQENKQESSCTACSHTMC